MRPRDVSFNINARMKDRIVKDNEITKDIPKDECKEKLEEDSKSRFPQEEINENTLNLITFAIPQYKDTKLDFPTRNAKPLKIHEKGFIAKVDPKFYEYFPNGRQTIDFLKMVGLFENQEQINEVDAESLLDVNMEKYGEFSEKLDQFLSAAQGAEFSNGQIQNEVLNFLQEKKNEVDMNIENVKNVACNVDKIDKIVYGDKTEIFFN